MLLSKFTTIPYISMIKGADLKTSQDLKPLAQASNMTHFCESPFVYPAELHWPWSIRPQTAPRREMDLELFEEQPGHWCEPWPSASFQCTKSIDQQFMTDPLPWKGISQIFTRSCSMTNHSVIWDKQQKWVLPQVDSYHWPKEFPSKL